MRVRSINNKGGGGDDDAVGEGGQAASDILPMNKEPCLKHL